MVSGIVIGAAGTLALMALGGYLTVTNGWLPARGDLAPDKFETMVAHKALHAVLAREATEKNPVVADATNLMARISRSFGKR